MEIIPFSTSKIPKAFIGGEAIVQDLPFSYKILEINIYIFCQTKRFPIIHHTFNLSRLYRINKDLCIHDEKCYVEHTKQRILQKVLSLTA